jgi:hypothetical protein
VTAVVGQVAGRVMHKRSGKLILGRDSLAERPRSATRLGIRDLEQVAPRINARNERCPVAAYRGGLGPLSRSSMTLVSSSALLV